MRRIVHDIRNQLAVAVANVEAMRDGVLQPSPERLETVLAALTEADVLLRELSSARPAPGGGARAADRPA